MAAPASSCSCDPFDSFDVCTYCKAATTLSTAEEVVVAASSSATPSAASHSAHQPTIPVHYIPEFSSEQFKKKAKKHPDVDEPDTWLQREVVQWILYNSVLDNNNVRSLSSGAHADACLVLPQCFSLPKINKFRVIFLFNGAKGGSITIVWAGDHRTYDNQVELLRSALNSKSNSSLQAWYPVPSITKLTN